MTQVDKLREKLDEYRKLVEIKRQEKELNDCVIFNKVIDAEISHLQAIVVEIQDMIKICKVMF